MPSGCYVLAAACRRAFLANVEQLLHVTRGRSADLQSTAFASLVGAGTEYLLFRSCLVQKRAAQQRGRGPLGDEAKG